MKFFTVHIAALFSFELVTVFAAQILIMPRGYENHKKPLGHDVSLHCMLHVENPKEVWNFKWMDPNYEIVVPEVHFINKVENLKKYTRFVTNYDNSTMELYLLIHNLTEEDTGRYQCFAIYEKETLATDVLIQTYQEATFTNVTVYQSALNGTDYKIECRTESIPPPHITWYRNGVEFYHYKRQHIIEPDGLVLKSVNESDVGEYRCLAVDNVGRNSYRDIRLEIMVPPKIVNTPANLRVTEGEKAEMKCEATGKPKPTITWIKTNTREVVSNGTDGILYIEKVLRNETTDYTCKAENKAGEYTSNVHLRIRWKPDIFEVKNGTAVVGEFGQIQCYVDAIRKPNVIFRKFTSPLSKKCTDHEWNPILITTIEDPTRLYTFIALMNFHKVQLVDDGLYECVATNDIGESVQNVHLNVLYAPIIDTTINVNRIFTWDTIPVKLPCITAANPNATIIWNFEDQIINKNDFSYTIFDTGSSSTLQVTPNNIKKVYGVYKCVANNSVGKTEWLINLVEALPPSAVYMYEVEAINNTCISCKIADFNDSVHNRELPVKSYTIQYKMEKEEWHEAKHATWERVHLDQPLPGALYLLNDFASGMNYTFRLAAVNEVGFGSWTKTKTIQMPGFLRIPNAPLGMEVHWTGMTTYEITWKIPSSYRGKIDYYKLKYCVGIQMELTTVYPISSTCESKTLMANEELTSYEIEGLNMHTLYWVSLRAHNEMGDGPPSRVVFKSNWGFHMEPKQSVRQNQARKLTENTLSSTYLAAAAFIIIIIVFSGVLYYFFGTTEIVYSTCGACCGKKNYNEENKLKAEFRFGQVLLNDRSIMPDETPTL